MKTEMAVSEVRAKCESAIVTLQKTFEYDKENWILKASTRPAFLGFGRRGRIYAEQMFEKSIFNNGASGGTHFVSFECLVEVKLIKIKIAILEESSFVTLDSEDLKYLSWAGIEKS